MNPNDVRYVIRGRLREEGFDVGEEIIRAIAAEILALPQDVEEDA